MPRLLNRGGMFSMMSTILLVFCAFSFAGALTLTGALTVIISRLLKVVHTTGQLIAATVATTILVTGATSDGKLALLIPAELFKGLSTHGAGQQNLSRTVEDAGTVIEPLIRGRPPAFTWPPRWGQHPRSAAVGDPMLCRGGVRPDLWVHRLRYRQTPTSERLAA